MSEVPELKQKLYDIEEKIRVVRSLLKDLESDHGTTRAELKQSCLHDSVERERYYYSGMHSAEYTCRCLVCDQEVTDETYHQAKKQRQI